MSLVAHFLKEADMVFSYERVSPFIGDTVAESHRSRNPLGKVPTLIDADGTIISESHAICRYLSRTYPEARRLYP
jgi:glutathione S-transferase